MPLQSLQFVACIINSSFPLVLSSILVWMDYSLAMYQSKIYELLLVSGTCEKVTVNICVQVCV